MAKHGRVAIGKKIKKLKGEGKTQKQAVGQTLGKARAGDLGPAAKAEAPAEKKKKKVGGATRTVRV